MGRLFAGRSFVCVAMDVIKGGEINIVRICEWGFVVFACIDVMSKFNYFSAVILPLLSIHFIFFLELK